RLPVPGAAPDPDRERIRQLPGVQVPVQNRNDLGVALSGVDDLLEARGGFHGGAGTPSSWRFWTLWDDPAAPWGEADRGTDGPRSARTEPCTWYRRNGLRRRSRVHPQALQGPGHYAVLEHGTDVDLDQAVLVAQLATVQGDADRILLLPGHHQPTADLGPAVRPEDQGLLPGPREAIRSDHREDHPGGRPVAVGCLEQLDEIMGVQHHQVLPDVQPVGGVPPQGQQGALAARLLAGLVPHLPGDADRAVPGGLAVPGEREGPVLPAVAAVHLVLPGGPGRPGPATAQQGGQELLVRPAHLVVQAHRSAPRWQNTRTSSEPGTGHHNTLSPGFTGRWWQAHRGVSAVLPGRGREIFIVGGRSGSTGTGRPPSGGEADSCRCSGSACGSSRRSCWSGPCTNLASASRRLGTALMTPIITRAVMIVKQTMITMARATSAMAMSSFILVLLDLVGHQLERLGADRLDHLGA